MTFLASVFITATILFTQMLVIYNKGLTVKQLTQTTRMLTEELSRAGNSATGTIYVGTNCLTIGNSYYIWNWTDGSKTTDSGFMTANMPAVDAQWKYTSGESLNFVKTQDANDCSDHQVDKTKSTPLLPDQLRVYTVTTQQLSSKLVRFSMYIGTYSGPDSDNNPWTSSRLACRSNSIGAFCQKMVIDTVFRLANGG